MITRYEDVRDAYRDPRSFSSVGALTMNRMLAPEVRETLGEHESFLDNFSANVDPPKHTRMRQAISRAFTPAPSPAWARPSPPRWTRCWTRRRRGAGPT